MAKTTIVPFGKYKGQPVEVLANDEQYCRWLADQEWFRTRFTAIHTLIINNFATPHETPEHNALQARFLDAEWCQRFALANGWKGDTTKRINEVWHAAHQFVGQFQAEVHAQEKRLIELERPPSKEDEQYHAGRVQHARDGLVKARAAHETKAAELQPLGGQLVAATWAFRSSCQFEVEGVDVQLEVSVVTNEAFPNYYARPYLPPEWVRDKQDVRLLIAKHFPIECKPLVGDDYPAILRQMKTTGARYLLADEVRSATVSVDQIGEIFRTAGIRVVTVAEVEATVTKFPPAGKV